jgi:hypothetical protein
MNYIITESQSNKLSFLFLDDLFNGYKVKIEKENRVVYLNRKPVIILEPNKAVVDSSILDELGSAFYLETIEDAKKMVKEWIFRILGVRQGSEGFYGIKFKKIPHKIVENKESKLDQVIDDFISSQFQNLTKKLEKVDSSVNRDVYRDKNGDPVIIVLEGMNKDVIVGIPEHIYSNVTRMFGMYDFFEIQKHLLNWFKKHMGLNLVAVETFSHGNDEYFY